MPVHSYICHNNVSSPRPPHLPVLWRFRFALLSRRPAPRRWLLRLLLLLLLLTPTQLVELKNGVTFNGHLVECDNFMNVTLREVYQTSADGDRFWKMKEMFIKGNMVSRGDERRAGCWMSDVG